MAKKERIWIDGHVTNCNLCNTEFVDDQVMFDAVVLNRSGRWHYLCPDCQKTRTMAGLRGMEESGLCIKYTYKPFRKE